MHTSIRIHTAMNMCRVDKWLLTVLLNCVSKYVVVFTKFVSSLSLYSLCKQLVAYAFRGGRDEGGAQGDTVPGIPHRARAAGLTLGAPAVDRGGRIFNHAGAHEENHCGLSFRGFVLSALTVFAVDFSGGIRWGSARSFVNMLTCCWLEVLLVRGEGSCGLCATGPLTGLLRSACQIAHLYRFSYRERRGTGKELGESGFGFWVCIVPVDGHSDCENELQKVHPE